MDQILALQEEQTKHVHFDQITMDELISEKIHDAFCIDVHLRLNEGEDLHFELNKNGLIVWTAITDQQIVITHALKKHVLRLNKNTTLAVHPGGRKRYARIRRNFNCPALVNDYYATVRH